MYTIFLHRQRNRLQSEGPTGEGCWLRLQIKSGACAQLFGFIRRLGPGASGTVIVMEMDAAGYLCIVSDDTSLGIDNMGGAPDGLGLRRYNDRNRRQYELRPNSRLVID
jgi:hypothetical protein